MIQLIIATLKWVEISGLEENYLKQYYNDIVG